MRFKNFVLLVILCISVLPLISTTAQTGSGAFEFTDCPFVEISELTVDCGYLIVPDDRSDPDSRTISLAVAIIRSKSANPQPDPILYLEGGPGGSALSGVESWFESPLLEQRDIILIDQRGTGYSEPYLGCPVDEEAAMEMDVAGYTQACRDALAAEGVNLAAYNSAASAADLNDLRLALGIEQWNLYGISYGTRLALTTMRDFPEGIRSVVIDSVYPPEIGGYIEQPRNGYLAFSALFHDRAADAACSAAFPDLESVFYQTVERLNHTPAEYTDPYGVDWAYYGDDLLNELFQLMYDSSAIPYLPMMLYEISQDNFATYFWLMFGDPAAYAESLPADLSAMSAEGLQELLDYYGYESLDELIAELPDWSLEDLEYLASDIYFYSIPAEVRDAALMSYLDIENEDEFWEIVDAMDDEEYLDLINAVFYSADLVADSDGMYNSVECYEEVPFNAYEQVVNTTDSLNMPDALEKNLLQGVSDQIEVCAIWGVAAADPAVENAPVVSNIPTLVVAGTYDPITPPAWAESAAQHLSSSYYYAYPGLGHGVTGEACPMTMMLDFLADPTTAPDDTCLRDMSAPDFVTP